MKKLYFLLFLACSFIANAQIVNIPDANFKTKLIQQGVDTNDDTQIQVSEAEAISILNVYGASITDLTGIEAFVNLTYLDCGNNNLTSLDVSACVNLTELYCGYNSLTSLDVSGCVNLTYLYCNDNNNLTSLDVSGCVNLTYLYCNDNDNLTSLDVSGCVDLIYLYCNLTYLTSLDVSNNINLTYLDCSWNNLTSLDVSNNINLTELSCGHNNLTSLDVSNNINLTELICSGNYLTSLDVSNNVNLNTLNCGGNNLTSLNIKNGNGALWSLLDFPNNPNLQYICADEEDVDFVQQKINTYGYGSTCHVNSYCSFTPNGTFYEISGTTKIDLDSNGCSPTDVNYPNLKFTITDGTNTGSFIANTTGEYYMPVQTGNHTVTPVLENPTYFNISPANFTVDFPTQASPFTQDFCVTANGVHNDVEIMVMPTTPARPGFDADYKIVYKNKGNQVENGTVSLTFDDAVLDYVTSNPVYNSNATNSFTWNYNNLQPFETREIEITFNVNSPMDSPAVNIDDVLDYSVAITTSNTEETPDDNTFELNQTVVGSYDPNDKTCLEGETVDVATVGKYVHYVIRFENTGTYPAQNIVVKDIIDTSKFDVSTLVPLDGSHEFYTRIKDNKVEFIFENINLDFNDATNDGYVAFKIKTLPTLTVGQTFSNDANIYFDYNFPITTNEYVTTIQNVLSNQDFVFENEFVLYPNPVKEVLNISSKNQTEISSIEIYNFVGQVVIAIPNTTKTIDISNLETGTYFIKVNSETGTTTTKFVKE